MSQNKKENLQEDIIGFLKSKGFVYPSSEIYGGLSGIYDYGHYGYLLIKNIKDSWMKSMIQERDDVYALDSAIFMRPEAWIASGHVGGFNDPQIDCRKCKSRMRADHILEGFGINADKQPIEWINSELDKLRSEKKLICDKCGSTDLTEARVFSLMVKSNLGSPVDTLNDDNVMYLRPETCGGIYLEYKNTLDSLHPKLPFGIAQIGKAFRNEIVAKQFIFRTREFEQMEMQYFFNPNSQIDKDKTSAQIYFENWKKYRWDFYLEYGIDQNNLKWYKHEKLAHYASDAYDIEYKYKMFGDSFKELEGIHQRGQWDLSQHSKYSGTDLTYFDEVTKERFLPHIMETSVGVARMCLAFIDNAYNIEDLSKEIIDEEGNISFKQDQRIVLKLDKRLSPIKVAILPLSKKDYLQDKARDIWKMLNKYYMCEYDDSGSIGKRYRRQDEIGTPYCITVDFDTIKENNDDNSINVNYNTVTIRDRDTMEQWRINIQDLQNFLFTKF